jgi:hypothetical protein
MRVLILPSKHQPTPCWSEAQVVLQLTCMSIINLYNVASGIISAAKRLLLINKGERRVCAA